MTAVVGLATSTTVTPSHGIAEARAAVTKVALSFTEMLLAVQQLATRLAAGELGLPTEAHLLSFSTVAAFLRRLGTRRTRPLVTPGFARMQTAAQGSPTRRTTGPLLWVTTPCRL